MEVDENKGTIRAYFSNILFQGHRPTKPIQRKGKNVGGSKGSKCASSNLTTTMKKSKKSGKKMGILETKGAKSKRKREQLTRGVGPDSSQMVIRNYFTKKLGIIGTGLVKKYGNIPMGDTDFL